MRLVYRPIVAWPGALTAKRQPSPFTATFAETLNLLDRELRALGAEEAVLQLAVPESAIRLDGSLRSDRKPPEHPGVILSFESRFGPMQYATDVFEQASWRQRGDAGWRQNLRAIALGLEALRKVDRYGISRRGEQYVGWKQLGAGTPMAAASSVMTVDEAAKFILANAEQDWSNEVADDPLFARCIYKEAAKRLHPDAGGNTEDFQRLQEAKALLDAEAARAEQA